MYMNKEQAKLRMAKLIEQIEKLRYEYHVLDDPSADDAVYDALSRELRQLEEKFPDLADLNSPLHRVGGKPLEKFVKVEHAVRMLSLYDVFSFQELENWEKRISKLAPAGKISGGYFCELKMDGLAVSIIYRNNILNRAATRGDGYVGEEITENIKTVMDVPIKVKDWAQAPIDYLEIRGEAVMSKQALNRLNMYQKRINKPLFANTRNAAAGSLRQLDSKLTASRKLNFFAYDLVKLVQSKREVKFKTHSTEHEVLRKLGFRVNELEKECANLEEVKSYVLEVEQKRLDMDFGTDGVVVSVNDQSFHELLGFAGKAPRYMVAYKYPAEKATTIIKEILISVGRTGVLTPVAVFEPTLVAGSVIAKATLHNWENIRQKAIKIGDTAIIRKAGDVIPEVVEVLPDLRTGLEKNVETPKRCPECLGEVRLQQVAGGAELGAALMCVNKNCPAKNRRSMQHFVQAMDIYEVGPKVLDKFQAAGLISDAADLFFLKIEDIAGLERFGDKSAENIIQAIENRKHIKLSKLIQALGILHVGEQTALDLALNFESLENLQQASLVDLNNVQNIGETVAASVFNFFHEPINLRFLDKLKKAGIEILPEKINKKPGKLEGQIFVITGTLQSMSREGAKSRIKALGGRVADSVSSKVSHVIVGENPGSKFKKAQELGVSILRESDLEKLLQ